MTNLEKNPVKIEKTRDSENETELKNSDNKKTHKHTTLKGKLDKFFKISERGSNFKNEILGGVVNFLVVCYVMVVVPSIICGGGNEVLWKALFLGTLLSIIFSAVAVAIWGNLPLVYAPGLGISSYMASLIFTKGFAYNETLVLVLISSVIFLLITITGVREKIIKGIPNSVKVSMPIGIGLFIANIGFNSSNSGIVDFMNYGVSHTINGVSVALVAGVAIFSFLIMSVLHCKKVKGAIFYGIISGTVLDILIKLIIGLKPFKVLVENSWLPPFKEFFSESFFNFNFAGLFNSGSSVFNSIITVLMLVLCFVLIDIFDTVGTIYGACKRGKLLDKNGDIPAFKRTMIIDSSVAIMGACVGVPTCSAYVESAAGIESGARTGFSVAVTGILFTLCLFLSPLVMLIPTSATSSALIFVGILMFSDILDVNFKDIEVAIPSFITIALMPFTGNIAFGIAGGIITYTAIMVATGKAKQVQPFSYICAFLFILYFATNGLF